MSQTFRIIAVFVAPALISCASPPPPASVTATTSATVPKAEEPSSPTPRAEGQPLPSEQARAVPIVPGAVLLRRTTAAEFRAFPEELAAGRTPPELAIGVEATDRTFTTDLPYDDAVSFYDDALQARGFKVPSRNVGAGATYWTVRSPDGAPARIAVRNTHPTSFEVVTAAAAVVAPQ